MNKGKVSDDEIREIIKALIKMDQDQNEESAGTGFELSQLLDQLGKEQILELLRDYLNTFEETEFSKLMKYLGDC